MIRDETYFFKDVYFQVENTCFRVWRHEFERGSQVFRDMFSLPAGAESSEGSSADKPIKLEGIQAEDFRSFLAVMFSRVSLMDRSANLTTDQWVGALKLAKQWEFRKIRTIAVEKLRANLGGDPARRVALAIQFDLEEWLIPALSELAQRDEPMNMADVNVMGVEVVLKIARVRESKSADCSAPRPASVTGFPSPWSIPPPPGAKQSTGRKDSKDLTPIIKQIFGL